MLSRSALPALALALGGCLLTASAWGLHPSKMTMGVAPKDYDDGGGRGGDPNPPAGCNGIQARITIVGTTFSPATVTVRPGEPVCWTWSQSVQHNVHADDDSFTSGEPAAQGTFQTSFPTVGDHGFYCQVHGSLTGGMRGLVTVRDDTGGGGGGGGTGPGRLALAPTAYTVSEGSGALTVTVARVGGAAGKASVKYATAPGTAKANKDYTTRRGTLRWEAGDDAPRTFQVPIRNDNLPEADKSFTVRLSKATGAALGDAVATVTIHDDDIPGCDGAAAAPSKLHLAAALEGAAGPCDEARALCLADGRFEAAVAWRPTLAGGDRASRRGLLPEAPGAGFFASSAEAGPEVTVAVLDRCGVNGHYWLSLAAATDVEFTVRVRDTLTGRTRVYAGPAGAAPSALRDAEAFASCP